MLEFAKILEQEMQNRNIKQVDIARQINFSSKSLSNYFTGRSVPDFNSGMFILESMKVDVSKYSNVESIDGLRLYDEDEIDLVQAYREMDIEAQKALKVFLKNFYKKD